jgi:hypothetical protein
MYLADTDGYLLLVIVVRALGEVSSIPQAPLCPRQGKRKCEHAKRMRSQQLRQDEETESGEGVICRYCKE